MPRASTERIKRKGIMKRQPSIRLASALAALVAAAFPVASWAQPAAGTAVVQPLLTAVPTADQIRMLLESSDTREKTWGAWWVAQTRVRNMDALLQANLRAHLNRQDIVDNALIDATLDAMIQVGGNAPPLELLQSVYSIRPTQGLILLTRVFPRPPANAFLLTLIDTEAGNGRALEWFAAANMLIRDRDPGLAAAILKGLQIQAVVVVCDRGQPCTRQDIGSGSIGDGFGLPAPGLPPWPIYSLGTYSPLLTNAGSAILSSGPVSIAYLRNVLQAGTSPGPGYPRRSETRTPPSPTTAERLTYIAALAPGLQIPIQDNETRSLVWQDKETVAKDVEDFRQDIVQRYSTLVQRMRATGHLSATDAEALAKPNLEITIDDRRSVRTPL
jgi:hypothetical protein